MLCYECTTQFSKAIQVKKLFLVKSAYGSSPPSCAVMCSNLRVVGGSCNIYYLDNGLCKVGVLDNPLMYSKSVGSSESLVEVKVLASEKPSSVGTRVKPGEQYAFCKKINFISILQCVSTTDTWRTS